MDNECSWLALEFATSPSAQAWSLVTNGITINGDLFTVQMEITGFQRVYRLRK